MITLDPKARSLSVDVAEAELALRRAAWQPRPRKPNTKGVLNNYARHAHCTLVCAWHMHSDGRLHDGKAAQAHSPDHLAPGSWRPRMSARPPPDYYLLTTTS